MTVTVVGVVGIIVSTSYVGIRDSCLRRMDGDDDGGELVRESLNPYRDSTGGSDMDTDTTGRATSSCGGPLDLLQVTVDSETRTPTW